MFITVGEVCRPLKSKRTVSGLDPLLSRMLIIPGFPTCKSVKFPAVKVPLVTTKLVALKLLVAPREIGGRKTSINRINTVKASAFLLSFVYIPPSFCLSS
jgi:hypothetical protein